MPGPYFSEMCFWLSTVHSLVEQKNKADVYYCQEIYKFKEKVFVLIIKMQGSLAQILLLIILGFSIRNKIMLGISTAASSTSLVRTILFVHTCRRGQLCLFLSLIRVKKSGVPFTLPYTEDCFRFLSSLIQTIKTTHKVHNSRQLFPIFSILIFKTSALPYFDAIDFIN